MVEVYSAGGGGQIYIKSYLPLAQHLLANEGADLDSLARLWC